MRFLGIVLVSVAFALAGCGGGVGGAKPSIGDGDMVGVWLDIAPAGTQVMNPERGVCWPGHLLTMEENGDFLFEDSHIANRAWGTYSISGNTVRFLRDGMDGTPEFFTSSPISFAFIDNALALTESSTQGTRSMQLSRTTLSYPALLKNEWVLVRRVDAAGYDLPCLTPVRLNLTDADASRLASYEMPLGLRLEAIGALLITRTGHAALRTSVPGSSGQLLLLGQVGLSEGRALALLGPNGVISHFVSRVPPETRLVGDWERSVDDQTYHMTIGDDGTYVEEMPEGAMSGQWRNYVNAHLAVDDGRRLRVMGWKLNTFEIMSFLTTREWAVSDEGMPVILERVWTREES